jgi:hypothetical protein
MGCGVVSMCAGGRREHDEAEALALTTEEIAMVRKARKEEDDAIGAEELRRTAWLKHALSRRPGEHRTAAPPHRRTAALPHHGRPPANPLSSRRARPPSPRQDFAKANELVTTAVEDATVLKAHAMASRVLCSCVPRAGEIERERQQRFAAAVCAYEWEMAEILAMHADELQNVADSKRRVLAMLRARAVYSSEALQPASPL